MDTLKDPAMLTALLALMGVIGSSTWSYRHINDLQKEIEAIVKNVDQANRTFNASLNQVISDKNILQAKVDQTLSPQVEALRKKVLALTRSTNQNQENVQEELEEFNSRLDLVIKHLVEKGAEAGAFDPPVKKKTRFAKPVSKVASKKKKKVVEEEEEEDEEEDDEDDDEVELMVSRRRR